MLIAGFCYLLTYRPQYYQSPGNHRLYVRFAFLAFSIPVNRLPIVRNFFDVLHQEFLVKVRKKVSECLEIWNKSNFREIIVTFCFRCIFNCDLQWDQSLLWNVFIVLHLSVNIISFATRRPITVKICSWYS